MTPSNSFKAFTPVRLSHLIRHCSVGAIMRSSQFLITVKDTGYWTNTGRDYREEGSNFTGRIIPYVEQVKKSLALQDYELREPPTGSLNYDGVFDSQSGYTIPAQIFPSWFVCSNAKCNRLYQPYPKGQILELRCPDCNGKLDQVNLVQVDDRGYLSEVPWYRIAHYNQASCHRNGNYYLRWDIKNNKVSCSCQASGKFELSQPRFYQGYEQPWIKKEPPKESNKKPTAHIMEVSDTRVYIPLNVSALVIPPESRIAHGTLTDKLYRHPKRELLMNARQLHQDSSELEKELRGLFECTKDALNLAIQDIENGYPMFDKELQDKELIELEYEALTTPLDFDDDEDFVTKHLSSEFSALVDKVSDPLPSKVGRLIDQVVAVNKLKEILVFKGFRRGGMAEEEGEDSNRKGTDKDQANGDDNETPKDQVIPPDLGKGVGWLPALELYGEGIFITLNEDVLIKWENDPRIIRRYEILARRYESSPLSRHLQNVLVLQPRFLLLHAFSHLLIKELESLAGYPAASLKEKIYSSNNIGNSMSGILIYTAIADVDGTLGGLVELAEPKRLLKVLTRVVEKMQWCSLDPVCAGHTGQGPSLLNMAACHACLLLPETSCMCGNVLLDRVLLKGDNQIPSVFDFIL